MEEQDIQLEEGQLVEATDEVVQDEVAAEVIADEAAGTEEPAEQAATTQIGRSSGKQSGERNWYVIHTYAGYEDQVAQSLKQRIESLNMADKIFDVLVPIEKQIEMKAGKRRVVEKKVFPGYVMVDMIVTDDSWYVVRNTPNVTGFIGFGVRPTPMSETEMENIRKRMGQDEPKYNIEFQVGDLVQITDGALKGFEAKVNKVDIDKGKVMVLVSMFGRETPVTLDYLQLKRM